METSGKDNEFDPQEGGREARLPNIDPVTFAALTSLDAFVARSYLSRQEHAEASRSMRHLIQTIEILQASVKELQRQNFELQKSLNEDLGLGLNQSMAGGGSNIIAGAGGQIFKGLRAE